MKIISNLFTENAVAAIGWTLVHSLWQGAMIMVAAASIFYIFRKKSANLRYLTGVGLLSAQVIISVCTFVYYFNALVPQVATQPQTSVKVQGLHFAVTRTSDVASYTLPFTVKMQLWLTAHIHELVICWLIGAVILCLRFLGGWIFTERLRLSATIVTDREWRSRFGLIVAKMNISKSISFKESALITTPMVIGAFSPVVLIPIGLLSGFSTSEVEAILSHELAHIRRNDYVINLLQSFVEVIFFFHPAIWWISNRIRTEREHCCDDIALSVCGDKMSLAHALVKVAEWQTTPGFAMAFASKKPLLLHRVQRVLGLTSKTKRPIGNLPIILSTFLLISCLSLYAVAQKSEKSRKAEKTNQQAAKKKKTVSTYRSAASEISEFELAAPVEEIADVEMEVPEIADIALENDSLNKKMNEIHKRMDALQLQMEPLRGRMEDIDLEMEKHRFEVERLERDLEKTEWKKGQVLESRGALMEKRSALFENNTKSNQSGQNTSDLDKQLADFEQQIKAKEEHISDLNAQIATTRKELSKAQEPIRKLENEMSELSGKMDELGTLSGLEALSFEKLEAAPRVARVQRRNRNVNVQIASPPAPPRANVPKAAPKPAKAPTPPTPPKKK